uniref:Uncharacterized protein n=1 Tax=Rhizophora mucronata TaxID=61149 RepID=A0A2P2QGN6_RHIMU
MHIEELSCSFTSIKHDLCTIHSSLV